MYCKLIEAKDHRSFSFHELLTEKLGHELPAEVIQRMASEFVKIENSMMIHDELNLSLIFFQGDYDHAAKYEAQKRRRINDFDFESAPEPLEPFHILGGAPDERTK